MRRNSCKSCSYSNHRISQFVHLSGSAQKKTTTWCQKIFNMQIITMVTSAGVPTEVLKIVILKFFGGGEFFFYSSLRGVKPNKPKFHFARRVTTRHVRCLKCRTFDTRSSSGSSSRDVTSEVVFGLYHTCCVTSSHDATRTTSRARQDKALVV